MKIDLTAAQRLAIRIALYSRLDYLTEFHDHATKSELGEAATYWQGEINDTMSAIDAVNNPDYTV